MIEEFGLNGLKALEAVIATSKYGDLYQAVASLSVFSHPDTCKQLNNQNLFSVIRQTKEHHRGSIVGEVMYDDNTAPTDAFIWTNGIKRTQYNDVQFNHIYADSANKALYTNLCNIVVTPAFIAKLTDKYAKDYLKFRAFELYDFAPEGTPHKPSDYDRLIWAQPLPPVHNVEAVLRRCMGSNKKNRSVIAARNLGWYFSGFIPDPTL